MRRGVFVPWMLLVCFASTFAWAAEDGSPSWRERFREQRAERQQGQLARPGPRTERFDGREIIVDVPANLLASGQRILLVVLHGGGGNAGFMRRHLNMDQAASSRGLIVAYMNGTPASKHLPDGRQAWNSGGGCCGRPSDEGVDDMAYLTAAVGHLRQEHGIDPGRVYVLGHSNGSMMAQWLLCSTPVFRAGVTLSAPINPSVNQCPAAQGRHILAIHGEQDQNAPPAGGAPTDGPRRVQKEFQFRSEASAKALFEQAGAHYAIEMLPRVGHALEDIDAYYRQRGSSLGERALQFLGL